MAEMQESWKDVAGKAEALGLKLKLHLEQEKDETEPRSPGDTKALIDDLGTKLNDVFDSIGSAAKDPAVHEDVKDVGRLFKDALVTTINAAGAEVSSRTSNTGRSGDSDPSKDTDSTSFDDASGDESDSGDA